MQESRIFLPKQIDVKSQSLSQSYMLSLCSVAEPSGTWEVLCLSQKMLPPYPPSLLHLFLTSIFIDSKHLVVVDTWEKEANQPGATSLISRFFVSRSRPTSLTWPILPQHTSKTYMTHYDPWLTHLSVGQNLYCTAVVHHQIKPSGEEQESSSYQNPHPYCPPNQLASERDSLILGQ